MAGAPWSRACSTRRCQLEPAASPATARSSEPETTSSACSPIDPVAPRMTTFFIPRQCRDDGLGRLKPGGVGISSLDEPSQARRRGARGAGPSPGRRRGARRRLRPGLPLGPPGVGEAAGASRCRGASPLRPARVRPRPLPDQRLLASKQRPLRLTEDPPADLRGGRRDRGHRGDRPSGTRRGRDRGGLQPLGANARHAPEPGSPLPREHRGWRQRRGAAIRRSRRPVGCGVHGQDGRDARLLLRHLPRSRRRRGAVRRGRAGAGDRGPDRPAARQRLARPARHRRRPPRQPRQGRDRRRRASGG